MKKSTTFVFLLLVILALTACTSIPGNKTPQPSESFRTGSLGLQLKFAPNIPPPKLYDTEEFNAVIEIANLGAFPVGGPGDRLYFSGFDPDIVLGIPFNGVPIRAEGKDEFNNRGGFDSASVKGGIRRLTGDKYPFTLVATACYGYQTLASGAVCIDPDPYSKTTKTKACVPQSVSFGTQAAPVAVGSVGVEARPGRTVFRIGISNVGGGEVYLPGLSYLQKCSPYDPRGIAFDAIDHPAFIDVVVSGVSIKHSCKPLDQNTLRLSSGKATLVCGFNNIRTNAAYTTPLTLVLRYGYRNQIHQKVEIVRT